MTASISAPNLLLMLPPELIDQIAEGVAARITQDLDRASISHKPYLTVAEAAEYIGAKPQRIYDLISARRLPRLKDGSRVLIERTAIDEYLHAEGR